MAWLIGPVFVSAVVSFIAVRLFEFIFSGATNSLASTARTGVSVVAWTAVTTMLGMREATKLSRKLRQGNASARSQLDALTKGEGKSHA